MSPHIKELLNLGAEVYRKKVQDTSTLHKLIAKCKELLIAKKILDDRGNFTKLLDLDQEIEVKKIVELLGYCYFLVNDSMKAYSVYQELVLSDDTPFNAWDENIPPWKVETFYTGLRDIHAKIMQLQEASQQEKKKKSEFYKEFYSLYFTLGYYSLAAEHLEKYLNEEPTDFEHWYMLAEYYEYKENYPKAIVCMENALKYALSKGYINEAEGYRERLIELRSIQ